MGGPRDRPSRLDGSGGRARGSQGRNDSQLLEQAQHVVACPTFDYLAVLVLVDIAPGHGHSLAARRDAHQLTLVGAGCGPPADDLVALSDQIFDREADVRKRATVDLDELPEAFRPCELAAWHGGGVEGRVGSYELVDDREVALVPDLFDIPACKGLVLIGHLVRLLFPFGYWCRYYAPGAPGYALPNGSEGAGERR